MQIGFPWDLQSLALERLSKELCGMVSLMSITSFPLTGRWADVTPSVTFLLKCQLDRMRGMGGCLWPQRGQLGSVLNLQRLKFRGVGRVSVPAPSEPLVLESQYAEIVMKPRKKQSNFHFCQVQTADFAIFFSCFKSKPNELYELNPFLC